MRLDNIKRNRQQSWVFAVQYGRKTTEQLSGDLLIRTVVNTLRVHVISNLQTYVNSIGDTTYRAAHDQHTLAYKARAVGGNKLGAGYFSVVFEHPRLPNKVIKFCINPEDEYDVYAQWCMTQNNKHIPKIHYREGLGNGMFIYVLDKMKHYGAFDILTRWKIKQKFETVRGILQYGEDDTEFDIDPELRSAMIGLYLLKETSNLKFDLHNHNMMVAEDGTLVITDPVY